MFKLVLLAALLFSPFAHAAAPCPGYANSTLESQATDAIEGHRLDCLQDLVARGVNLHQLIGYGRDALDKAAWVGDLEISRYLLSIGDGLGDLTDQANVYDRQEAVAFGGNLEILKLFQSEGLPLKLKNGPWGESYRKPSNHFGTTCSPLFYFAVEWTQSEMVAYLITQGVDIDARCDQNVMWSDNTSLQTPLIALGENYLPVMFGDKRDLNVTANATLKILLEAGADLRARDDYSGKTAASILLSAKWINKENAAFVRAHSK